MTRQFLSVELSAQSRQLMKRLQDHANFLSVKNAMNSIGGQYRREADLIFRRKQPRPTGLRLSHK